MKTIDPLRNWITITLLTSALNTEAVIVFGGDGSQNTTAPLVENGWSNVGIIDSETAPCGVTYLSDNWFITANHVWQSEVIGKGVGSVRLQGNAYPINTASSIQLQSPNGNAADLRLFRVADTVQGARAVRIASKTYGGGTEVTMIGHGMNRDADITDFGVARGYYWGATGSQMRWGTNQIEPYGTTIANTTCFQTDFDGVANEAQATLFDSGGGVFVNDGGDPVLAGIMIAAASCTVGDRQFSILSGSPYGYQPALTYIADLSVYRNQINLAMTDYEAIPEPSSSLLMIGSVAGAILIRKTFLI